MWFFNLIYWLQIFIAPVILFGMIGLIAGSERLFLFLVAAGSVIGIVLAELVRRKYGLENFFGKLYNSGKPGQTLNKKEDEPG